MRVESELESMFFGVTKLCMVEGNAGLLCVCECEGKGMEGVCLAQQSCFEQLPYCVQLPCSEQMPCRVQLSCMDGFMFVHRPYCDHLLSPVYAFICQSSLPFHALCCHVSWSTGIRALYSYNSHTVRSQTSKASRIHSVII